MLGLLSRSIGGDSFRLLGCVIFIEDPFVFVNCRPQHFFTLIWTLQRILLELEKYQHIKNE